MGVAMNVAVKAKRPKISVVEMGMPAWTMLSRVAYRVHSLKYARFDSRMT